MSGLETVEMTLSNVIAENDTFRFDSEYFSKTYIAYDSVIKKMRNHTIGEFASVTDGIHTSILFDDDSDIHLISAMSPKNNFFDLSSNKNISKKQHSENPRTSLRVDDVIVSTVGTIGNCAVVDKNILPANSDRHVGIIRIHKDYKPRFVSTFLLTKYGRFQSIRYSTGNVQLNLFIYKIKQIRIPFISEEFQASIETMVSQANELLENSNAVYLSAEQFLLSELGLADFKTSTKPIAIKAFTDSFDTSGRLDAEYYQPKYEEILTVIKAYKGGYSTIGNLAEYLFTGEYSENYENKANGLRFYIRGTNMNNGRVETDDAFYVNPNGFTKLVTTGDIVTGRVGTLGVFAEISDDLCGSVYSDNVLCFRLPDKYIPSVYTLLLNTKVMRTLVERTSRGSVQQRLNQETLRELTVPLLTDEVQQRIFEEIQNASTLRSQSEQLLAAAKDAVEIAIEKSL